MIYLMKKKSIILHYNSVIKRQILASNTNLHILKIELKINLKNCEVTFKRNHSGEKYKCVTI